MHTPAHIAWGISKHLAFGYLLYSIIQHWRGGSPDWQTVSVLLFGTMFPDLIDKALVFSGFLGYGRGFAHSLLTAVPLILLTRSLTRRLNRAELGTAFGIGYLSHIPIDLYGPLLTGSTDMDTAFLLWPVLVEHSLGIETPQFWISRSVLFLTILGAAFLLWLYDGMPIVSDIVRYVALASRRAAKQI